MIEKFWTKLIRWDIDKKEQGLQISGRMKAPSQAFGKETAN